jgi:phenylacetate-coenzyme A ligase PaaK-like adenylate-forming protein
MRDATHITGPSAGGWGAHAQLSYLGWMSLGWDVWLNGARSREAVAARGLSRFRDLVQYARSRSSYYRRLYGDLPAQGFTPGEVPPTVRRELMACFDESVTDPEVTRASVEAFVSDPGTVGQAYLGRYAAWTSSGTAGEPGVFVHDGHALAVYDALEMQRLGRGLLAPAFMGSMLLAGGRYAMVAATGGHFAGVASVERMRLLLPALADRLRVFSILEPLPRLITALNAYQPSLLATYPTVASLLAAERQAGRLTIKPAAIWLGGETLTAACRAQLGEAFRCRILEEYSASECMSIACECPRGRLHLNSDWAMIEPVDRDYRPVAPGVASYTALLTNLANRVQPVIRYDLGDSITFEPEACGCGSPLPTLRVEGRHDEAVSLRNERRESVTLAPLALTTVVEDIAGAHRFQIVQRAPDSLAIRMEAEEGAADAGLWEKVLAALRGYLSEQGLPAVSITRDAAPPERSSRSGKVRRVIAMRER